MFGWQKFAFHYKNQNPIDFLGKMLIINSVSSSSLWVRPSPAR